MRQLPVVRQCHPKHALRGGLKGASHRGLRKNGTMPVITYPTLVKATSASQQSHGVENPPTELKAQKQANAWKASEQGFRVSATAGPHNTSCYAMKCMAEGLPRKEEGSSQSP